MQLALTATLQNCGSQASGFLPSDSPATSSRGGQSDQPFAQQFTYHLQDPPIVRRNQPPKPDGSLAAHLTDLSSVQVEYNPREAIEDFRASIRTAVPGLRIGDYHVVSRHGLIADGMTRDEYFLTPGADLIVIRKGIGTRQQLISRRFWLKSRESTDHGRSRPPSILSPLRGRTAHRITPYRMPKGALKFAMAH
jgi:hypothetical protein